MKGQQNTAERARIGKGSEASTRLATPLMDVVGRAKTWIRIWAGGNGQSKEGYPYITYGRFPRSGGLLMDQ